MTSQKGNSKKMVGCRGRSSGKDHIPDTLGGPSSARRGALPNVGQPACSDLQEY
jgi:hypothetical protein